MDHQVTFIGKDPVGAEGRVRCSCGWTEKCAYIVDTNVGRLTLKTRENLHTTLMLLWEKHVYTPQERALLTELGG